MTIDERIEALTARHEALAQTVEIVAGMQQENQREIAELKAATALLLQVAQLHEARLQRIEGGVV